ncbi:YhgE/Pip domain-containing protein [Paenibacillus segetis]|uniref:YhgE/Pip domain-containing protein n=1 Tax=Paenibacillus segetis TaxID=1325360 RepID=UPI001665F3D4|nr:ABC transporter permease [Paenibacillus segetis]
MFNNKLFLLTPIISLLVVFIFCLALFPSVQIKPKNLPIAVVNEDLGVEIPNQPKMNMGQTIVDTMQKSSSSTTGEDSIVKWVEVESAGEVEKGLNDQKYYAAIVIPQDFSEKQASLSSPSPTSPEVQIYINQGMNASASTMAGQVLNGLIDNMSNNIRTQLLEGFKKQGVTLTVDQAESIATPIIKKVTNVNEIGTNSANGNSPVTLFQPLWMACVVCALLFYNATKNLTYYSRMEKVTSKLSQIGMGVVVSLVIGFGLTWLAEYMVGLHIPQFAETAIFLSITFFSFFLMIYAVVSWVGFLALPVFGLLLFFGAPLLALAPEMMSPFYQNWVYDWLPMRFMVSGLRELFFFGKGLNWSSVATLTWIGLVSAVVILASVLKPQRDKVAVRIEA